MKKKIQVTKEYEINYNKIHCNSNCSEFWIISGRCNLFPLELNYDKVKNKYLRCQECLEKTSDA